MAGALVTALLAPLLELEGLVGTGQFVDGDPVAVMRDAGRMLDAAVDSGTAALHEVAPAWSGAAAEAAQMFSTTTMGSARAAALQSGDIASTLHRACESVADARNRLRRIIDQFTAVAEHLEAGLPHTAGELVEEARVALAAALGVVADLESELDAHTTAMTASSPVPVAAAPTPATSPAAFTGTPAGSSSPTGAALMSASSPWAHDLPLAAVKPDIDAMGTGVTVTLPDGSTVTAPNGVAADAVRHALTQLGVPYVWGGTTPGVGLDCSGLTQWAYREAGLDLPRLAQEQDLGTAVSAGALLPGDLAVWDGHVAMVVGNGMMVEAGDPVQLSSIRTTNAGQGFQGFWRPTA